MRDLLFYLTRFGQKKKKCLFLFLLGTMMHVNAQNKISGTVSDSQGLTLPSVSVNVKGNAATEVTDVNGKYEIDAPSDATLVFNFIGFVKQEIAVKGKKTLNVKLQPSTESLDEVVLIGYGSQKKKDVNGSISSIKSKDLENLRQVNIDQMLQGKAAGVSVSNNSGQPGSAASIRIRGTTSLTGTNEPLYIIDGMPVSGDASGRSTSGRPLSANDFTSGGGSGNNAVSPLSSINPNDVESIDILKDASATAIYGSRGANGVIIITTKSGKKGTGKISYEGFTSAQSIYKKLEVMDLRQYATHQNNLTTLFGNQLSPEFAHPELLGKGTDWQDEVYRTALTQSHQLSFSAAKDGTNYYLSTGFLNQEGILLGSGLKRYTMRLNLDSKVKDWLRVGANVNTGITNENITVNQSFTGLISNTLLQSPFIPVREADGSFGIANPTTNTFQTYFNPVAEALTKDSKLIRKNFMGNMYAELSLFKGLKYRVEFGANTEFSEFTEFRPSSESLRNITADLTERRQTWYSTNIKNLLTYDLSLGKNKVTLLAGQEAQDSHWSGVINNASNFQTNSIYALSLSDPTQRTVQDYKGSASIQSVFGRFIYDFDNKYNLSASVRTDVSSKFDPTNGNQKGNFYGAAFSWKLSNEKFMEGFDKYIGNIKFRAGYGQTGNQQIDNNRYTSLLGVQNSAIGPAFLPNNFNNPDLQWESLNQTNFGLDFTILDSRLSVSLDTYVKESSGFLFQVPLTSLLTGGGGQYGGLTSPISNLGVMKNTGVDVTLGYTTKGNKDFSYNSSLVFSHYKNELTAIQNGLPLTQEVQVNGYLAVTATNTLVGNPIGMFYGYVTEGIFNDLTTLNAAPLQFNQTVGTAAGQTYLGDYKFKDVNGDGVIDEKDRTFIGNPHPDFTFGFTNNFRYKNFDLSLFLQGSYGNDILNLTRRSGTANSILGQNALTEASNYWTPTNTNTSIPRPINAENNPNYQISDRYVEDGSYVRIQNLTLGYNLPQNLINKIKMSRVRIYSTVSNLYTFTKYKGYDPEIGSFNQNVLLTGIDNGRYPSPRTYSLGINVEF